MIGSIVAGIGSVVGGLFGKSAAEKQAEAQAEVNRQMLADKERDRELQREFAQSGIQWKVQDAKKAGLHPLYAMGGSGATYTPSSISLGVAPADNSLANMASNLGQDIGRAVHSTRSQSQRQTAFVEATQQLSLRKMALENDLLASQVAKINSAPNPPMPVGDRYLLDGQSGSPVVSSLSVPSTLIETGPMKRTASAPGAPWQEPGSINDAGFARTSGGQYPVPSRDVKDRIEDNFWHETAHFARNNLLPAISPAFNDPPYAAPAGKAWVFNPVYGYKLVPDQWHRRFFRY